MTYRYVEHAGARIAYRVSGSGPALVLLKNNRHPPDYPVSDFLAERFRVFQLHPIGFGASDRPDVYDFGSIGQQVLAVLDHEGVDRFGVWGFSQTACMAAMVARSTDRAGIGVAYLEFEGLNHSTCGLGDAAGDGRRVAQEVVVRIGGGAAG